MVSPASHPRLLGRYALYEKIASGGMASVHIGRLIGPEGFARTVAVKRMHAHFAEDPAFVAMFLDEARVAARIRHPNVVQTLDIVAMEGELFLVMDFVQGESLSRLIATAAARRERIPPAIVATIMVGVLHGLHAAHEAKNERGEPLDVVHRDVSPHNVLVGVDGVARVLDFGVAKAIGRAQTTRDGQLKGKIAYMAPEQIRGNVTRSADVYAASVVLWEALTGMRFITGDNEVQVLERALSGSTEPPSKYAGFVTPALDAVTMRGLAVDPTKRFATAREMARAIEQTIGLATASEVGDWVESTAKTTLDERSARIASIESDSSVQLPAFLAAARSPSLPDGGPPLPAAPARVVSIRDAAETVPTEASASAVSFPSRVGIPGLHGRGTWIAGGGRRRAPRRRRCHRDGIPVVHVEPRRGGRTAPRADRVARVGRRRARDPAAAPHARAPRWFAAHGALRGGEDDATAVASARSHARGAPRDARRSRRTRGSTEV